MRAIGVERGEDNEEASIAINCRRLWAQVVLHALNDWWSLMGKDGYDRDATYKEALRYFRSRDGRLVTHLAGMDAEPERMALAAVSAEAKALTIRAAGQDPDRMRRHRAKKEKRAVSA